MRVLDQVPAGAGKHTVVVPVPMEDGSVVTIPVHVVQGRRRGTVLLAVAGEHGIEVNGVAALDRLARDLDPADVVGTLIAVPAVNPANVRYRHHTHAQPRGQGYTWEMPWNTVGAWPGDARGNPAERIAAALTAAVVADADAVVNLHCWGWHAASCAFATRQCPRVTAMARAFGLTFVRFSDLFEKPLHPTRNTLVDYNLGCSRPAFMAELSGHHMLYPESVERALRGVRSVMAHLELLDEDPFEPDAQYEVLDEAVVSAPRAGLFVPLVRLEQPVAAGEPLGYLLDVATGARTDVASPCEGVVWLVHRIGAAFDVVLEDMHAYADAGDRVAIVKQVHRL